MSQQQSVFSETEKKAIERYIWWPIYLVREKRRLAGITEAVRSGAADPGAHYGPLPTPEVLPGESAEEFLLRAEQQGEAAFPDPMTIFENQEGDPSSEINTTDIQAEQHETTTSSNGDPEDTAFVVEPYLTNIDDMTAIEDATDHLEAPNGETAFPELPSINEDTSATARAHTNADRVHGKAAVRLSRANKTSDSLSTESL